MRLHRITAQNNHMAMTKINKMLGPDALIYSTRSVPEGVEIVVGMPHEEVQIEKPRINTKEEKPVVNAQEIERLNKKLHLVDENVRRISTHLENLQTDSFYISDDDQAIKRNHIFYYLSKNGFRGQFCHQFIKDYLSLNYNDEELNLDDVQHALAHYIQTPVIEPIDDVRICALLGPTGVGKTTTIAKLANRYVAKYGRESIGIIATDFDEVSIKNQLIYYAHKLKVDLEYANNVSELALAIESMKDKDFILIDTYGVSQRDHENVTRLRDFIESQGDRIASYITFPCNVQDKILDEIAAAFRTLNVRGSILTKQDESISIAPAVSVAMSHQLPIAYICNGQDIANDIAAYEPSDVLNQILIDSINKSKFSIEGRYGRQ